MAKDINIDELAQKCIAAINDRIKNLKRLNIIIVGKSGVGKSTLINSLFRDNIAETGLGRPVTKEIRKIVKKDYPLTIYDTPGLELRKEQQATLKDQILDLIEEGLKKNDISEAIHCIWYCINVGGNRTFDDIELSWLKELTDEASKTQVPVIVVLTQGCPRSKTAEMKDLIEKENLHIVKVVPVLAQDMNFDDEYIAKSYGLDTLIDVMTEALPEELQNTLQNIQKASIEAKRRYARQIVAGSVTAAFGEGFVPVPFSDAAMLIPTQVGMIAGITSAYGIDVNKGLLTAFVSSTIGAAGATVLGKTIVANLLKLIPGAGTVVGGLISGGTAGLLTTALGEAYIGVMELIYQGEIDPETLSTEEGAELIKRMFIEELSKSR